MANAYGDLRDIVALSLVKNMGPVSFRKLMERFGGAKAVFAAKANEFARAREGVRVSWGDLRSPDLMGRADREIEKARKRNIDIISMDDDRYPSLLREIYDPPVILYVKGVLPKQDSVKVAVVGSRISSLYGKKMATEISRDLAASGAAVVSGLALGIDTAAHEGALSGGGSTIAVLGGGIGKLYPPQNKKLADSICANGALVSEYPVDMEPRAPYFPVRNRIISGLSNAVLVVEAKEKSGALITADAALEQGREVFALPGNADSPKSLGTNSLLKQGARLALCAQDILGELGFAAVKKTKEAVRQTLNAEEGMVLRLLESGPVQLDEMVDETGLSLQKAMTILSGLQIKKFIKEAPGKYFQKV